MDQIAFKDLFSTFFYQMSGQRVAPPLPKPSHTNKGTLGSSSVPLPFGTLSVDHRSLRTDPGAPLPDAEFRASEGRA